MSHGQQQQFVAPSTRGGVSATVDNSGCPNIFGHEMDANPTPDVQPQTAGSQEHNEKRQAAAAVHQHFEESLRLAQQQKVSSFCFLKLFLRNSLDFQAVIVKS